MNDREIRIGVSACLLGEKVRYDGGHKRSRWLTDVLAEHCTLVPVCPEAEVGMGIPRETVRLAGDVAAPRMVAPGSGKDWTTDMNRWSRRRIRELAAHDLDGFIFKKDSPSCGVFRTKVYQPDGQVVRQGRGLFAAAFTDANPLTPVEEEGRLNDSRLRENFVERVFALNRVRAAFAGRWRRRDVIDFHAREKYFLLAHGPAQARELGRLVATIADLRPAEFRDAYMRLYMEGLSRRATVKRHLNVLQHIAGHLRRHVDGGELGRVHDVIGDYGRGLTPLIVPITLLAHLIERHDVPYVKDQVYLRPHPKELMLRNHV